MFTRLWHFLLNTFLFRTRSNYKMALELGLDHQARLTHNQGEAVVASMLLTFNPVLQAFVAADLNLNAALGDYKSDTLTVKQLFNLMNTEKLSFWEGQVHAHFPKGTPEELQYFPRSRKLFQTGTYSQRIQAIKVLGTKCAAIAVLNPVSVDILAFHLQLESARALQMSDGKARVAALRDIRELARVAMCTEMYGNLGLLMHLFRADTVQVERFFDLTLLRRKTITGPEPIIVNGTVVHRITGVAVPNATVAFTLPSGEHITVQTDGNGNFTVELGTFAEAIDVTMQVTAAGFEVYTRSGPVEPGEDIEIDVQLDPMPTPPTPPTP